MSTTYYYQGFSTDTYQSFTTDDYQAFQLTSVNTVKQFGIVINPIPAYYTSDGSGIITISGTIIPARSDTNSTTNSTGGGGGGNNSGGVGVIDGEQAEFYGVPYSVYKFMGCSVIGANLNIGYNGTPSSLSVTLVEDVESGDSFVQPLMPSLFAFSLPSGGINQPILYPSGVDLGLTDAPFYFAGICTNWGNVQQNIGGRTINVSMVDPKDILTGVQCLLGGFALSQNIGDGNPRFTGVYNIIDVFGYYNYGYESERNVYGMPWYKIQNVIENSRVTINGINFEFWFSGSAFDTPIWYRIDDNVIDLMALCQKVCQDGGADLILRAVKVDDTTAVVEIRGIQRNNLDPLTISDISGFVSVRNGITENVKIGREYRNEATSNVVVGGFRNSNYVAFPTTYTDQMHNTNGLEDYSVFPSDIKVRLFPGSASIYKSDINGGNLTLTTQNYNHKSGAIYPFWGFASLSGNDPMVEPFLPLDHLIFDRNTQNFAHLTSGIPLCRVDLKFYEVREVAHNDVFLQDDGSYDSRPFGYVSDIKVGYTGTVPTGYMRGLPLNTEVLRAALVSEIMFYETYNMYYPDVASGLRMPRANWGPMKDFLVNNNNLYISGMMTGLENLSPYFIDPLPFMGPSSVGQQISAILTSVPKNSYGQLSKASISTLSGYIVSALDQFNSIIYEQVRQYANDYCGKQFVVMLPKSNIMERMWNNLEVPTNVNKPEIEYVVDQSAYWEYVPDEFSGVGNAGASGQFTSAQENQIVRRFAGIDGRFAPMIAIDWKPSGNVCFNSNSMNRAMFQDLPTDSFRPNQIADSNPSYIFVAPASIDTPVKRPDTCIVTMPTPISFDNLDAAGFILNYNLPSGPEITGNGAQGVINYYGIIKFLQSQVMKSPDLRYIMANFGIFGEDFQTTTSRIINHWAKRIYNGWNSIYKTQFDYERVMDLKAVIIPLTSNWVRYGPWYETYDNAAGMVKVDVDENLVPWNFIRPPTSLNWDYNLNLAGEEKVIRSLAITDYVDSATITCTGFPELGIGTPFGFNSNITSITVDLGIGGIKTTYVLATYAARPGTYRKGDYDNVAKARVETRPRILDPINNNLFVTSFPQISANRFPD